MLARLYKTGYTLYTTSSKIGRKARSLDVQGGRETVLSAGSGQKGLQPTLRAYTIIA